MFNFSPGAAFSMNQLESHRWAWPSNKSRIILALFLMLIWLQFSCAAVPPKFATSVTYSATGAMQTFTVPLGVTSMMLDLRGAAGGFVGTNNAGFGARVVTNITVTPSEVLNIFVGAAGLCTTTAQGVVFGGGGASSIADVAGSYGGTGGGATDVRRGGAAVANRIAVAGGGGGIYKCAATNIPGGHAGQVGSPGSFCFGSTAISGGTGGTATAGGTGGYYTLDCTTPNPAGAGTQTAGGTGILCRGDGAGGGGGGYWGGGGGINGGSGGGGSSFSSSASVVYTTGFNSGAGKAILTWSATMPSSQPSRQPSNQPTAQPSRQPSRRPSLQPSGQPSGQPVSDPSRQPSSQPSGTPSKQPSTQPSSQPSAQPISDPSVQPSNQPTRQPSRQPYATPSAQPSAQPSRQPSSVPSVQPSCTPTTQPSSQPSARPSVQPTSAPSGQPSCQPSVVPSEQPTTQLTGSPSRQPSSTPSCQPTCVPTTQPSTRPTRQPSGQPTASPSDQPSDQPTAAPSQRPSGQPGGQPTERPSRQPTSEPSVQPTLQPSAQPSVQPSRHPTSEPTKQPFSLPSVVPSSQPTVGPTRQPTSQPSQTPSRQPTSQPISLPSCQPSSEPTSQPTGRPTCEPSNQPSVSPTAQPTGLPSVQPSEQPSTRPSSWPSTQPSVRPSTAPSRQPSALPSCRPSSSPSEQPTECPTAQPTKKPSVQPSRQPSALPSGQPTAVPTSQPLALPTAQPSSRPSGKPSSQPSGKPTVQPSTQPSATPSRQPSGRPSCQPSAQPTRQPLSQPSGRPSEQPSNNPTQTPSSCPSLQPSGQPTVSPTTQPSRVPSVQPSSQPTRLPSNQPSSSPTVSKGIRSFNSSITLQYSLFDNVKFRRITLLSMFSVPRVSGHGFNDVGTQKTLDEMTSYILYGSNSSTDRDLHSLAQPMQYDYSGRSVSILGDINDDGYDDVIIGVPFASRGYVLLGTRFGFVNMTRGFTIYGAESWDKTGWAVSSVGDINNDTFVDFIMGSPGGVTDSVPNSGTAYVIFGHLNMVEDIYLSQLNSTTQGLRLHGESEDYFGISVSSAGDVNGDGFADVLIGTLTTTPFFSGGAYILFGGTTAAEGTANIVALSQTANRTTCPWTYLRLSCNAWQNCGVAVSSAGDVNGDGFDDILMGSVLKQGVASSVIQTFVVFGNRELFTFKTLSLPDMLPSQGFVVSGGGTFVSGVGDINGDGLDDVLLAGTGRNVSGFTGYVVLDPPSALPTVAPTRTPTRLPTASPTRAPTFTPTFKPTATPTAPRPTADPTLGPTSPTSRPSSRPTTEQIMPSSVPTQRPTWTHTGSPTNTPHRPSSQPSSSPSCIPTIRTACPTVEPTLVPTVEATVAPTEPPTRKPSLFLRTVTTTPTKVVIGNNVTITEGSTVERLMPGTTYVVNASDITVTLTGLPSDNALHGDTFTIVPNTNCYVTIELFGNLSDVIDLRLFRSIVALADVNMTRGSVIINLPNRQTVRLVNRAIEDMTSNNFMFYIISEGGQNNNKKEEIAHATKRRFILSVSIGSVGGTVCTLIVAYILYRVLRWYREKRLTAQTRPYLLVADYNPYVPPATREPDSDDDSTAEDSQVTGPEQNSNDSLSVDISIDSELFESYIANCYSDSFDETSDRHTPARRRNSSLDIVNHLSNIAITSVARATAGIRSRFQSFDYDRDIDTDSTPRSSPQHRRASRGRSSGADGVNQVTSSAVSTVNRVLSPTTNRARFDSFDYNTEEPVRRNKTSYSNMMQLITNNALNAVAGGRNRLDSFEFAAEERPRRRRTSSADLMSHITSTAIATVSGARRRLESFEFGSLDEAELQQQQQLLPVLDGRRRNRSVDVNQLRSIASPGGLRSRFTSHEYSVNDSADGNEGEFEEYYQLTEADGTEDGRK